VAVEAPPTRLGGVEQLPQANVVEALAAVQRAGHPACDPLGVSAAIGYESRPVDRVRVMRIIARLNMGGPAHHVSILSGYLDPERYVTRLLAGSLAPSEGSLEHLPAHHGAQAVRVGALGPELSAQRDLRALGALVRAMTAFRPDIVHTHTAKAGMVGRMAALLAPIRRPLLVHTFHGHVLRGYFGPAKTKAFLALEQGLATRTDRLIGVSQATVDELVEFGVAPRERFRVIPLGLDLRRFAEIGPPERRAARRALGIGPDARVVSFVGRFAPIKRVDVLIAAFARAAAANPRLELLLAGDGETRPAAEAQTRALRVDGRVRFLGFREDLDIIAGASDIAALSSENEGTPVALIEAGAAGCPAVATHVGGVPDIVTAQTGRLVAPGDAEGLAAELLALSGDLELARRMGDAARSHCLGRYSAPRLVADVEALYGELFGGAHRR